MSAHSLKRSASLWTGVLCAAGAIAVTALSLTTGPKTHASPVVVEPPDSPMAVAEALDSIVQPRFFQLGDELFGMSRIARPVKNHPIRRFTPESPNEKPFFDRVAASGRECHIFFYQTVPALVEKPAFSRGNDPFRYIISNRPFQTTEDYNRMQTGMKESKPLVEAELSRLKAGEKRNRDTAEYAVFMRPVRSAEACVSCHKGTTKQDILGVMVYVVSKERRTPATQAAPPPVAPTQQLVPTQRISEGWERELVEIRAAR